MPSYIIEDNVLDLVCDIDSAAQKLKHERCQRLHSYSNRMDVDAKMMKNEHLPESARIGDSDEEVSI